MNGCFVTSALRTSEDNVNLYLYTDFPEQTIMVQSGSGAANLRRNLRRNEIKDTQRKKPSFDNIQHLIHED